MANYDLETSAIWSDVQDIIYSETKPVKFNYTAQLHTTANDVNILKVISIDTVRDYANYIGDVIQMKFKMALGDYMMSLYPYRTNLELTIKRTTLAESGKNKKPNSKILVRRYKAVFIPELNQVPAGSDLEQFDQESLNKADFVDVTVQLLDRSLEILRIKQAPANNYRDVTQKQLINNLLGGGSLDVLIDGKPSIDGIDIVEPDNKTQQSSSVIKQGTLISSIPTYLHEKMGGVYSTGIGTYLQYYNDKHMWFVYPVFNTSRYDTSKSDKMIIYAIPQEKLTNIDRTYTKEAGVLKIVATANRKYQDSADVDFMNSGSGFRMADARAFMKKPVEMTKDGPKGRRTQLNHETAMESREDGMNYAPVVSSGPSANPYVQYSIITGKQLARVDVVWENSDVEQIYPGMPVCYVFLDNNKPVELKGTLVFAHTVTALQGNGINSNIYKNVTNMVILVTQITIEQKLKARKAVDPTSIGTF